MKYKVLLFDADETLFDFKKAEANAIKNTFLDFNLEYDENYHLDIYHNINSNIWKEFEEGLISQENLKTERFKRLGERLNLHINEIAFAKSYLHNLSLGSFLFDESEEIIKKLSKNYKLAIITNGLTVVQKNRISKSTIAKYFEEIIISEEIGLSKPNSEIFEYTLNKIGHADKDSVLMMGDSLTSDIKGGMNFGIDTCWYNPYKIKNTHNFKPTYEIYDLKELKEILS